MSFNTILVTLIVYQLVLLGIGMMARTRTRDGEDLYLGGRRLGGFVAAISASASSSSVWTLLGVSGAAYHLGLSAAWLFPSCVGGFALNWFLVAPRLRRLSATGGALTLTGFLAGPAGTPGRRGVIVFASVITLLSLMLYVASQLNGASKSFESILEMDPVWAILLGSVIVVVYTIAGGFWAVSLTDALQGMLMAATAVVLPLAALVQVGGPGALLDGMRGIGAGQPGYFALTGAAGLLSAAGLIAGTMGIGLGYPGQPHVVNRFMALRDEQAMRRARIYAMAWAVCVYAGMLVLGWCARILLGAEVDQETAFFAVTRLLFPEIVVGVVLAAVLSALMSTADSQLLVAAAAVSEDLRHPDRTRSPSLLVDRLVILGLTAAAVLAAICIEATIYQKVLFAWTAMGAAFGPLLLWRLWRGPLGSGATLLVMAVGFAAAVLPDLAGFAGWFMPTGFHRYFLPYLIATPVLLIAGCWPRRSPD